MSLSQPRNVIRRSQINEPGGVVGIEADGTVPAIVGHRQGDAATLDELVLKNGEIAIEQVDGAASNLRVGDGATAGGLRLNFGTEVRTMGAMVIENADPNELELADLIFDIGPEEVWDVYLQMLFTLPPSYEDGIRWEMTSIGEAYYAGSGTLSSSGTQSALPVAVSAYQVVDNAVIAFNQNCTLCLRYLATGVDPESETGDGKARVFFSKRTENGELPINITSGILIARRIV